MASVLCLPFVASRGIQLLLKEELSSVWNFRGVTWGSCKVASVTSKDIQYEFKELPVLFQIHKGKKFIV